MGRVTVTITHRGRSVEVTRRLYDFLVKEKILRMFAENVNYSDFDDDFMIHRIGAAFTWSDSPQGYDYWLGMHNKQGGVHS